TEQAVVAPPLAIAELQVQPLAAGAAGLLDLAMMDGGQGTRRQGHVRILAAVRRPVPAWTGRRPARIIGGHGRHAPSGRPGRSPGLARPRPGRALASLHADARAPRHPAPGTGPARPRRLAG